MMVTRWPRGELTVRAKPKGGGLRPRLSWRGPSLLDQRPMLIFIHGFANDESRARRSYAELSQSLCRRPGPVWGENIWWFYWPGDGRFAGESQLLYPYQISHARDAAAHLAAFLGRPAGAGRRVVLVAHSLGCRVALETLRLLDARPDAGAVQVEGTCLLAAAVPVPMCKAGQPFGSTSLRRRQVALHSRSDRVLQFAFRIGQSARLDGGLWPEAVGRFGNPDQRWAVQSRSTGLGHGEYYSAPATKVALRYLLGWHYSRTPEARTPPVRTHGQSRLPPERRLPVRMPWPERAPTGPWRTDW